MLVISVVEKYFRLRLKYLIPLKKVNLLYINYCCCNFSGGIALNV